MTIKKRIKKAIIDFSQGDLEDSLIQVFIAIDATAKKEGHTGGNGERCKKFLDKNRALITKVGFGFWEFQGKLIFGSGNPKNKNDSISLEEILYHSLRCTLLHEGTIPDTIIFCEETVFGSENGKYLFPKRFVMGLIFSVIGSPANKNERLETNPSIDLNGNRYFVNDLWGKSEMILKIFRESTNPKQ